MPSFNVAHVKEQGQNMLLFPLDSSFDHKPETDQKAVVAELEMRAHRAGLAGRAAAIWESGGRTHTLGPPSWAGFLRSLSMRAVLASVNKKISW